MFSVNETFKGRGVLTVKDGKMWIHVSLRGNKINHLFCGTAAEATNSRSRWLDPTVDTVTYDDGTEEKVSGFNIPVEKIGVEFPVALIGKKGIWYDHMVSVSDVQ